VLFIFNSVITNENTKQIVSAKVLSWWEDIIFIAGYFNFRNFKIVIWKVKDFIDYYCSVQLNFVFSAFDEIVKLITKS
jgi:hypothetical protein